MKITSPVLWLSMLAVTSADPARAAELYRDEMTSGASWGMNSTADTAATFGYNYSADGIPEAPNSILGNTATSGVKLTANNGDLIDAAAYFTLYPVGKNFTGNYQLRFDAWMNFDADELAGAAVGTTEFLGGGIGYDNVTADVASGAQLIATGDGGSGSDWRAFKSPPQFFVPATDMAAGSRNGSDPYYANFLPAVNPPVSQGQSNPGVAGSIGFQWVTFEANVIDDMVSFWIEKPGGDRLLILSYDKTDTSDGSSGVSTDGNISIFYADFFSSITPRPDRTFGIVDNVVVSTVPEPTAISLLGIVGLGLAWNRLRNRSLKT